MRLSHLVAATALSAFALAGLAACGDKKEPAAPPTTPTPTPTTPTTPTPTPTPTACDQMSRAQCLASTDCTLHHLGSTNYDCRPAVGPCEVGLRQGDRTGCQARSGCTFDPGSCYCSCEGYGRTKAVEEQYGGCACACAGGPPSMCKPTAAPAP